MNTRSRETSVTFAHPFTLKSLEGVQPAGTYRVVIDEDEISNISFLAYRRVATMLHLPAVSAPGGSGQVFTVSSEELEKALEADQKI